MPRDLTTAQQELAEARGALDALTERVREGDDDVTPEQLAAQRELISFAELRVQAAERKETRIREEERVALGAAAKDAAEQLVNGPGTGEFADAMRAAVDAIGHLTGLVHARNVRINEVGTTLTQLDEDLKVAGETTDPWGSKRYGVWGDRKRLIVPDVGTAPYVDLGDLTVAAVVCGLGVSLESREAADRHMHRFHGLRDQGVRNTLETYPWLADTLRATSEEYESADGRGKALLAEQGRRPQ